MSSELQGVLAAPNPAGLQEEMRAAVHVRLYSLDTPLTWSKSTIPTLSSLSGVQPYLARFLPPDVVDVVLNTSPGLTPFEAADGLPLARMPAATAASRGSAFASAFRDWVAPAAVVPQTRLRYDSGWSTVVTYAIAYDMLPSLWPTQPALLESLLFFGIALEMQAATLTRILTAVSARHSQAETPLNVHPDTMSRWRRAMKHGIARPASREYLPFRIVHLHAVLSWPCGTVEELRDKLIIAEGMVLGPRPSELARIDVCDLHFAWRSDPEGTAAVSFYKRKNDMARKGHFPRIGQASCPSRDIVQWLRLYLQWTGFSRHAECTKVARPRAPCHKCGLLFRRLDTHGQPLSAGSPLALLSPMDITNIVRSAMARLGEDPALYRGRSLRHGCVTAGFEAHLEEYLVYLQTGHRGLGGPSAVPAGRLYAMLTDPAAVYALFRVFRL